MSIIPKFSWRTKLGMLHTVSTCQYPPCCNFWKKACEEIHIGAQIWLHSIHWHVQYTFNIPVWRWINFDQLLTSRLLTRPRIRCQIYSEIQNRLRHSRCVLNHAYNANWTLRVGGCQPGYICGMDNKRTVVSFFK